MQIESGDEKTAEETAKAVNRVETPESVMATRIDKTVNKTRRGGGGWAEQYQQQTTE